MCALRCGAPRAWLVGLMLLDLMGTEYSPLTVTATDKSGAPTQAKSGKHFTFERALVHPSRLDDRKWARETNTANDTAPRGWVDKQARRDEKLGVRAPPNAEAQKTFTKMSKPGSAAVEGLFPPSPKWSGRSSDRVDVANDYIQAKQVGLLCRWLEQEFNAYLDHSSGVRATALAGNPGPRRNALTTNFGTETGMHGFAADLTRIIKTELITRRAGSFNSPGMLFR